MACKIFSWHVRGLNDGIKRCAVMWEVHTNQPESVFLQETNLARGEGENLTSHLYLTQLLSTFSSYLRRVGVLLSRSGGVACTQTQQERYIFTCFKVGQLSFVPGSIFLTPPYSPVVLQELLKYLMDEPNFTLMSVTFILFWILPWTGYLQMALDLLQIWCHWLDF